MRTASQPGSQRFSNIAGFKPIKDIFSNYVPAPTEGFAQVLTELTFEAFYTGIFYKG